MAISVFPAPSAASKTQKTVRILSTQSWTVPADVTQIEVWLAGGGGSGGGGSSAVACGGGGSVTYGILTVTPNTAYTVTIGAGGAGVSNANFAAGNAGGTSSFGALLSVAGGGGGPAYQSNSGAVTNGGTPAGYGGWGAYSFYSGTSYGGPATPGDIPNNLGHGGAGSMGFGNSAYTQSYSRIAVGGGNSAGQAFATSSPSTGNNAMANSGSGGAGTAGAGNSGNGGSGICIIKYWSAL